MNSSENIQVLGATLQQAVFIFNGLFEEYTGLRKQCEDYKLQYLKQKEDCEKKACKSYSDQQQISNSKENLLKSVANALITLKETKNFDILEELLQTLHGYSLTLTPPGDSFENIDIKLEKEEKITIHKKVLPLDKINMSVMEDLSLNEESVIEGTPKGRTSPILMSKKISNKCANGITDSKEKKNCSISWTSLEAMVPRHSTPSKSSKSNGKMIQTRLNLTKPKCVNIVDLTSSPEFRENRKRKSEDISNTLSNIKEECMSDDTILPSPTSGPVEPDFSAVCKNITNNNRRTRSSKRLKKPSLLKFVQPKLEFEDFENNRPMDDTEISINILQPRNPRPGISPPKHEIENELIDNDATHFDSNENLSLMQHLDDIERDALVNTMNNEIYSTPKLPLADNINADNVPTQCNNMPQLLRVDVNVDKDKKPMKRKMDEKYVPLYKEPTVRKKAEKLALPGWSCDQCEKFYDILYKDDPVMLGKLMDECSRHRGRHNPLRPRTPPGYWYPRWTVADDTETFNRENNAQ